MALDFRQYTFRALRNAASDNAHCADWLAMNRQTSLAMCKKADLEAFHQTVTFLGEGTQARLDSFMAPYVAALKGDTDQVPPTPYIPPATQKAPAIPHGVPTPPQASPALPANVQGIIAALAAAMASPIDEGKLASLVEVEVQKHLAGFQRVSITINDAQAQTATHVEGLTHKAFPRLLKACAARGSDGHRLNVWLHGPAGSGKTFAAGQVAKALKLPFGFHGSMSMPHELIGFVDAGGKYHETQFTKLFKSGGVCLLDEVDSGENGPLLALQAALANGSMSLPNGEIIKRHDDFICIAAGNTTGQGATADYVGRTKIDGAFLSRFPVMIGWDYDEQLEQAFCGNPDFAECVQKARAAAKKLGLKVLITPRHASAGAALMAAGHTLREAAEATFLSCVTGEQALMLAKEVF